MNYSPLKLFLVLANTEGKFNLVFLGTGQRRLIFMIEKIPSLSGLGSYSKHCHRHIIGQPVGKSTRARVRVAGTVFRCRMVTNYELINGLVIREASLEI